MCKMMQGAGLWHKDEVELVCCNDVESLPHKPTHMTRVHELHNSPAGNKGISGNCTITCSCKGQKVALRGILRICMQTVKHYNDIWKWAIEQLVWISYLITLLHVIPTMDYFIHKKRCLGEWPHLVIYTAKLQRSRI